MTTRRTTKKASNLKVGDRFVYNNERAESEDVVIEIDSFMVLSASVVVYGYTDSDYPISVQLPIDKTYRLAVTK